MYGFLVRINRLSLVVTALVIGQMVGGIALADRTKVDDPKGDGGAAKKDIDYTIADHHHGLLRHRARMYGAFETYHPRVCLFIQTSKSGYRVCGPTVYRVSDNQPVGEAKVRRPSDHVIALSFKQSAIGSPSSYHWYFEVGSNVPFCPNPPCDITRNVVHRL
jgi:hypothetical protein